ncbi:MAG: NAD(P)-dependent oxidoreductase [Micavibrio aeruginosavorus]|uniref:NAD(P)-dependent oxidoreductase n=1 Tax=Micavibrio aeruginosavorus TaxID=349221 RepID=A0A2W5A368_9BACT|nr:MAG: NAD(P)-dependent oxidoreductase [Micavibrio aeruginosavorus]
MTIGITGATGQLGRLVIEQLKNKGLGDQIVALVRDPTKAADLGVTTRVADYNQPDTLDSALAGIDRLLLISSNDLSAPGLRAKQHEAVIAAAKRAGVQLLAYTSLLHAERWILPFAEDHKATEKALKESGIPYVLLRNGWYTENYTAFLGGVLQAGVLYSSSQEGKISLATRLDYADAAAAVIAGEGHAGKTYELAGDLAHAVRDILTEVSAQTGASLRYEGVTEKEHLSALSKAGIPEIWASMIVLPEVYGVAEGLLLDENRTLSTLIGRPTTPLKQAVTDALQRINQQ